jgi:hypothetical protein
MQLAETVAIRLTAADHCNAYRDQKQGQQRERAPGAIPGKTGWNQQCRNRELEHRQEHHHGSRERGGSAKIAQGFAQSDRVDELSCPGKEKYRGQEEPDGQRRERRDIQHIGTWDEWGMDRATRTMVPPGQR